MANTIDLAKNHITIIWQQGQSVARKIASKVDRATLIKIGRIVLPILGILIAIYLIKKLLKNRNITMQSASLHLLLIFQALLTKTKELARHYKLLPPLQLQDIEKGAGLKPVQNQLSLSTQSSHPHIKTEQMIINGQSVMAIKQDGRVLQVAMQVQQNGLQMLILGLFNQKDQNSEIFSPQKIKVFANEAINPQFLLQFYNQMRLPNGFSFAPLNGFEAEFQIVSNMPKLVGKQIRLLEMAPIYEITPLEQSNAKLLQTKIAIGQKKLPNIYDLAIEKWQKEAHDTLKENLKYFSPFKGKETRKEFDHKNAEILNQVMRFVFICYWATNSSLEPENLVTQMQLDLNKYNLDTLKTLFEILSGKNSFSSNEEARTKIHEALCDIWHSEQYQQELRTIQEQIQLNNFDVEKIHILSPLVFFAQTMARAFYLEVDLNEFEERWVRSLVGSLDSIDPKNYADWVSKARNKLDIQAKGVLSLITNAWREGLAPLTDYTRIQSEKLVGSMEGMGFNAIHTNNCAHRLWTQNYTDKQNICIGMPVPTRDNFLYDSAQKIISSRATADMVEDLKLLLDNFALTGQTFMSFMHLKIADKKTCQLKWSKGEENIRAKALLDVALSKRYQGTYWYFSIPLDGYLFEDPSKISYPAKEGYKAAELVTSEINGIKTYRLIGDNKESSLYRFWMRAVKRNLHGWYLMHEQLEETYGDQLRKKYDLKKPGRVVPQICHNLFMEIHQCFFKGKQELTLEEWQVFQVLLGVRLIETFSQFADVFHNTCKDAIDRAAVFLMARRYLQLIREGKTQDAKELYSAFIDYVKRAVAAKVQAPIPHRHHTTETVLKILEKFNLQDEYLQITKNKPEANYTMDRETINKRFQVERPKDLSESLIYL